MQMIKKRIWLLVIACVSVLFCSVDAKAAELDPVFYATLYPAVVPIIGDSPEALYNHYITYGMKEGRIPYAGAIPGEKVSGIKATTNTEKLLDYSIPIPKERLMNYSNFKKRMSETEFEQAYEVALQIVTPLIGLNKDEQLYGIATSLRTICDNGLVYSTTNAHYNDPYGYLVIGTASCSGCARTTGLCLNILGIPYEHVNENQWCHQWCRVNIGGEYWICDAFGLYCGPEPAPYVHPYL